MSKKKWVQTDEPRLIDGKKLYRRLIQLHKRTTDKHDVEVICRCMNFVKSQKTVEFVQATYAHWIETDYGGTYCSHCEWGDDYKYIHNYDYCPSCGTNVDTKKKGKQK